MIRTFNVFVDNGLFVLSHYINKKIEHISVKDIENSSNLISEVLAKFVEHPAFNPLAWGGFSNSCYTQPTKTNRFDKIVSQIKLFIDSIGNEECSICGNHTANFDFDVTRSYMPGIISNTFYNYSNNLKGINICPICLILSMYSILNMRQCEELIIYNSDNNDFMYNYTKQRQDENAEILKISPDEYKKQKVKNSIKLLSEEIEFYFKKNNEYKGYLQPVLFKNFGQDQSFRESFFLSQKYLKLLHKIYEEGLYQEFLDFGLLSLMLEGNFENRFIFKLIDYEKQELKSSLKLFNLLDKGVDILEPKLLELIKNVCNNLMEISQKDEIKDLKEVTNSKNFEKLILKWQENYKRQTGKNLLTMEEFDLINNKLKFNNIKNRMISYFIVNYDLKNINKNEGVV